MIQSFTLKPEHIKLLRAACWVWDDGEFGAPAIDCKRPYGNTSVYHDIHQILGWAGHCDDHKEEYKKLHGEIDYALQVLVDNFGGFCPCGEYERVRNGRQGGAWELKSYVFTPTIDEESLVQAHSFDPSV